jgi:hypothetical protein
LNYKKSLEGRDSECFTVRMHHAHVKIRLQIW